MAIAVVQSTNVTGSSVTSVTTPGINTTTGNLIVLDNSYKTNSYSSQSDNGTSNAWTNSVSEQSIAGLAFGRENYNANINGKTGHTFTLTLSAAADCALIATEISGQAASPLDQTAVGSGNSNSVQPNTAATATTSQANELLMEAVSQANANATYTFTAPRTKLQDGGGCANAYRIVAATGTYSGSATQSITDLWTMWISTWKEAAAATATVLPVMFFDNP